MERESIAGRLMITEGMADMLTEYLRGDGVYREQRVETPGGSVQVIMTLGALLENMAALLREEDRLSAEQRDQVAAIARQVEHDRAALPGPWHDFLRRELLALLNAWRWYLDELDEAPRAREDYSSEVRKRLRIDLILHELAGDPGIAEERHRLEADDNRLRQRFGEGEYIGPAGAEHRYPPDRAWWLYGHPV